MEKNTGLPDIDHGLDALTETTTAAELLKKKGQRTKLRTVNKDKLKQWILQAISQVRAGVANEFDDREKEALLEKTQEQLEQVMKRAAEAEKQVKEREARDSALEREINNLRAVHDSDEMSGEELAQAMATIEKLTAQREEAQDDADDLRADLYQLQDQLNEKISLLQATIEEKDRLNGTMQGLMIRSGDLTGGVLGLDYEYYAGRHQEANPQPEDGDVTEGFFHDFEVGAAVIETLSGDLQRLREITAGDAEAASTSEGQLLTEDLELLSRLKSGSIHAEDMEAPVDGLLEALAGAREEALAAHNAAAEAMGMPGIPLQIDDVPDAEGDSAEVLAAATQIIRVLGSQFSGSKGKLAGLKALADEADEARNDVDAELAVLQEANAELVSAVVTQANAQNLDVPETVADENTEPFQRTQEAAVLVEQLQAGSSVGDVALAAGAGAVVGAVAGSLLSDDDEGDSGLELDEDHDADIQLLQSELEALKNANTILRETIAAEAGINDIAVPSTVLEENADVVEQAQVASNLVEQLAEQLAEQQSVEPETGADTEESTNANGRLVEAVIEQARVAELVIPEALEDEATPVAERSAAAEALIHQLQSQSLLKKQAETDLSDLSEKVGLVLNEDSLIKDERLADVGIVAGSSSTVGGDDEAETVESENDEIEEAIAEAGTASAEGSVRVLNDQINHLIEQKHLGEIALKAAFEREARLARKVKSLAQSVHPQMNESDIEQEEGVDVQVVSAALEKSPTSIKEAEELAVATEAVLDDLESHEGLVVAAVDDEAVLAINDQLAAILGTNEDITEEALSEDTETTDSEEQEDDLSVDEEEQDSVIPAAIAGTAAAAGVGAVAVLQSRINMMLEDREADRVALQASYEREAKLARQIRDIAAPALRGAAQVSEENGDGTDTGPFDHDAASEHGTDGIDSDVHQPLEHVNILAHALEKQPNTPEEAEELSEAMEAVVQDLSAQVAEQAAQPAATSNYEELISLLRDAAGQDEELLEDDTFVDIAMYADSEEANTDEAFNDISFDEITHDAIVKLGKRRDQLQSTLQKLQEEKDEQAAEMAVREEEHKANAQALYEREVKLAQQIREMAALTGIGELVVDEASTETQTDTDEAREEAAAVEGVEETDASKQDEDVAEAETAPHVEQEELLASMTVLDRAVDEQVETDEEVLELNDAMSTVVENLLSQTQQKAAQQEEELQALHTEVADRTQHEDELSQSLMTLGAAISNAFGDDVSMEHLEKALAGQSAEEEHIHPGTVAESGAAALEAMKISNDNLVRTVEQVSVDRDELKKLLRDAKAAMEEYRAREAESGRGKSEELAELKAELVRLREDRDRGATRTNNELEDLQLDNSVLRKRVEELKQGVEDRDGSVITLKQELDELAEIRVSERSAQAKVEALTEQVDKSAERIKGLEHQLSQYAGGDGMTGGLREELEGLKKGREDMQAKVRQLEDDLAIEKGRVDGLKEVREKLREEFEEERIDIQAERDVDREALDESKRVIRELKEKLAGMEARVRTMTESDDDMENTDTPDDNNLPHEVYKEEKDTEQ